MASKSIVSEAGEDLLELASSVESIFDLNSLDQLCRACESPDVAMDLSDKENYKLLLKFRACVDIEVSSRNMSYCVNGNIINPT